MVFQSILDQYEAPRELMATWQPIALACKPWQAALMGTPVGLELKAAAHLSEPALRWMAKVQIEVSVGLEDVWAGGYVSAGHWARRGQL
jgi:hypothetical protein